MCEVDSKPKSSHDDSKENFLRHKIFWQIPFFCKSFIFVWQIVQQQQFEVTKQTVVSEGVQSKALRDKLMELETEIEKFRSENAALTKLRKEREEVI